MLVANFKMHQTREDLRAYLAAFPEPGRDYPHTIVFCPPFTGLDFFGQHLPPHCHLGAQNLHAATSGAHTGEISAAMLRDMGVEYVIVGHPDRRANQHETDTLINQKIKTALAHRLQVIVCLDAAPDALAHQINTVLQDVAPDAPVYLAYEPHDAVNSGQAAPLPTIRQVSRTLQQLTPHPVLYGGSVTPQNAAQILAIPEIDGVLVGNASLDPQAFAQICQVGAQ